MGIEATIDSIISILEAIRDYRREKVSEDIAEEIDQEVNSIRETLSYREVNEEDLGRIEDSLESIRDAAEAAGIEDSQYDDLFQQFDSNLVMIVENSFDLPIDFLEDLEKRLDLIKRMMEDDVKKAPDGAPMQRMSEYNDVSIPEGFGVYIVKDEESKHYNQMFTFDEGANHRLVEPHKLLEKVRKTEERERELGSEWEDLKKQPIRAEKIFIEFLKQKMDMTYSEFDKASKEEKIRIKQTFKNWFEEQGGL